MAKILFSDVDGTLIEKGEIINLKNIELMKKMQKEGHYIALCTGRNPIDIKPILEQLNLPYDYLVLCNGSYIEDRSGNILFKEVIDLELGRNLINTMIDMQDLVVCFCSDSICPILLGSDTVRLGLHGLEPMEGNFFDYLKEAKYFYMLSMHHKDLDVKKTKEAANILKQKYHNEIDIHLNQMYVDITPAGHSKGTGLNKLVELLGDIEESYAIGDSFNDLSMIKAADIGATFKYAKEEIQNQSDVVVSHVYELIEKLLS